MSIFIDSAFASQIRMFHIEIYYEPIKVPHEHTIRTLELELPCCQCV